MHPGALAALVNNPGIPTVAGRALSDPPARPGDAGTRRGETRPAAFWP
jgi:hypothetical protein